MLTVVASPRSSCSGHLLSPASFCSVLPWVRAFSYALYGRTASHSADGVSTHSLTYATGSRYPCPAFLAAFAPSDLPRLHARHPGPASITAFAPDAHPADAILRSRGTNSPSWLRVPVVIYVGQIRGGGGKGLEQRKVLLPRWDEPRAGEKGSVVVEGFALPRLYFFVTSPPVTCTHPPSCPIDRLSSRSSSLTHPPSLTTSLHPRLIPFSNLPSLSPSPYPPPHCSIYRSL